MTATKAKDASKFSYDPNFQRKIARVLFQDPDFTCTTASHLKSEHFESSAYQWIVRKITTYAAKTGTGIGLDALNIELGRDSKIGKVTKDLKPRIEAALKTLVAKVPDKTYIKEEVYRFVKNQTIRQAIMNSVDHLGTQDYEAIDKEFQQVLEVQTSFDHNGLGKFYVRDVQERTLRRKKYEKNGIATGLRVDDYLKPAGLPPKNLGVIVAPSGKGKSFVLVHLGKSAIMESQAKVLHVTLELSEEVILDRYDAAFSGVALNQLEAKRVTVKKQVQSLGQQYGEFLVVKEFPPGVLSASALRTYIRQLERLSFYPDVVIVDYGDLMVPSGGHQKNSDAYEEMGSIYTELRRLSYEVNAPVWTASQTQRSALNKEVIDIDSISDSFKKVMIADLVICLAQSKEQKQLKHATLFIAKNRHGSDKIQLPVSLDWAHATLRDL